jgi:hypothetical protein
MKTRTNGPGQSTMKSHFDFMLQTTGAGDHRKGKTSLGLGNANASEYSAASGAITAKISR